LFLGDREWSLAATHDISGTVSKSDAVCQSLPFVLDFVSGNKGESGVVDDIFLVTFLTDSKRSSVLHARYLLKVVAGEYCGIT
jgi:hypothetical protein